jgi:phosphatidylglycerol---prolipoprotein diacylglyceryl transferase
VHFPVYLRIWKVSLHPHYVMEFLAYAIAFQVYLALKRRFKDVISPAARWQLIAAATFGAVFGSRILAWLDDPILAWHAGLAGGKTIVGALVGGWIAVEVVKTKIGIPVRTGDLFIPLAVGIAIGRVGCFLTGLSDQTYGSPTTLPWAIDFGDGIRRHPTQLYEIVFLILLSGLLWRGLKAVTRSSWQTGDVFRAFMIAYSLWRIGIDFLKPEPRVIGMSAIQWACVRVVGYCWRDARRMFGAWRPLSAKTG